MTTTASEARNLWHYRDVYIYLFSLFNWNRWTVKQVKHKW